MTKLAYGRTLLPAMEGKAFRNARFFTAPEEGVESVWIDGDYPEIEAAYAAKGVKTYRLDAAQPTPAEPESPAPANPLVPTIVIPADWRDLPWSQPDERGLTLRGLASDVSAEPVKTKDEAVKVIEAHLAKPPSGSDAE